MPEGCPDVLQVGMSHILSNALGGQAMMAFWYHFLAILFEALFILTAVDAGTARRAFHAAGSARNVCAGR